MDDLSDRLDFIDRSAWRSWLENHHASESAAWLVIQKVSSTLEGLPLDEAVEEALCFGWIDGKLLSLDDQRYLLRFSPRKPNSIWSASNIQRVEKLMLSGDITEAGLATIRIAKENGQWQAALDREQTDRIPSDLEAALRRKKGALAAYRDLPASKKKQYLYWLQGAKREQTRTKRIEDVVKLVISG